MRVIIIEDELPAANRLTKMLQTISDELEIVKRIDSVEAGVKYLQSAEKIDLIFMDIQLADGLSFDIFQQTEVKAPVIFTTAFDQYTLKAFKVNSIDYLLKPVQKERLIASLQKFETRKQSPAPLSYESVLKMLRSNISEYKSRFMVKIWSHLYGSRVDWKITF